LIVSSGLVFLRAMGLLNGFSAFVLVAVGCSISLSLILKRMEVGNHRAFEASYGGFWRMHWKYSRWVLATAFVFQLLNQGYYWLLSGILSVREVAEFRAVQNIVIPIDQVFIAFSMLILPTMAKYHAENMRANLLSTMRRLLLIISLLAISYAIVLNFAGRGLLELLYHERYNNSVVLLLPLSLIPIISGMSNSFNIALKAIQKPNVVFYAYSIAGVVTLTVGILLIMNYGVMGAAYGMIVSTLAFGITLITGFYIIYYSKKNTKIIGHLN